MAVVIIYALFDLLAPKKKPEADLAQRSADLSTFVADLTGGIEKGAAMNSSTIIFSRAEKEWARDPFLDGKALKSWNEAKSVKARIEESPVQAVEFVYSGYFEVGRKRMAIINGIEYNEGEVLDVKGYVLKSVSPSRVLIENRGIGAAINVPLQE